jgi:hypothetical protein
MLGIPPAGSDARNPAQVRVPPFAPNHHDLFAMMSLTTLGISSATSIGDTPLKFVFVPFRPTYDT